MTTRTFGYLILYGLGWWYLRQLGWNSPDSGLVLPASLFFFPISAFFFLEGIENLATRNAERSNEFNRGTTHITETWTVSGRAAVRTGLFRLVLGGVVPSLGAFASFGFLGSSRFSIDLHVKAQVASLVFFGGLLALQEHRHHFARRWSPRTRFLLGAIPCWSAGLPAVIAAYGDPFSGGVVHVWGWRLAFLVQRTTIQWGGLGLIGVGTSLGLWGLLHPRAK